MSKRNRREHGRILSVETMQRGSALDVDAAAGATTITVADAGDFDEDGGWLYIGAQVVEFTACDDDTGVITLSTALAAAAEQGDPVHLWSELYREVVDYQQALVELDGEYDNPDPVVAEVAEGIGDLPEGDRGKAGESCTLLRVADDEWEVVGVGGRPRSSSGSGGSKWEANDSYTLTAADIAAGTATVPLSHRPDAESVDARWRTTPQESSEFTVNYDAQTVTWPLSGFEEAGDRLWFHYTYRQGITVEDVPVAGTTILTTGGVGPESLAVTVVGAVPQWADLSDATYAALVSHREGGLSTITAAFALLTTTVLSGAVSVRVRIRLSTSATLPMPEVQLRHRTTGVVCYSATPSGACPLAPEWVTFDLAPTGGGAADLISWLAAGDARVRVLAPWPPLSPNGDFTTYIYEVQVIITEETP